MSENPYESPKADIGLNDPAYKVAELRQLASDYFVVNVNLIISSLNHALMIVVVVAPNSPAISRLTGGMEVGLAVFAFFCLATLVNISSSLWVAHRLYPVMIGLMLAVLSVMPVVGLIVFVLFRRRAAALLEDFGLNPGLWGVDQDAMEKRIRVMQDPSGERP